MFRNSTSGVFPGFIDTTTPPSVIYSRLIWSGLDSFDPLNLFRVLDLAADAEHDRRVNKTQATEVDPLSFVESIEHATRRADALVLLDLMKNITGCEPKMWGPTIIGFGRYHYVYDSGREGDMLMTGFSPRKANQVLYVLPGYEDLGDRLDKLGKHKLGKSCLYVTKLADVNMDQLEAIIRYGVDEMKAKYETFDE